MKTKSLIVQVLTVLILAIGSYSGMFSPAVAAWLGIISMAATLTLSTFFPSGTIVTGWTWVMWATNISGVVVQILNLTSENGLIAPNITNSIIIAINIFIQVFLKDYNGGGSIVEKKVL